MFSVECGSLSHHYKDEKNLNQIMWLGSRISSEQQYHPHLKGVKCKRTEMPYNRTSDLKFPTIKTFNKNWENVTLNELNLLMEEAPSSGSEDVSYYRLSSCVEGHAL